MAPVPSKHAGSQEPHNVTGDTRDAASGLTLWWTTTEPGEDGSGPNYLGGGSKLSLRQLLIILRRRWLLIAASVLVTVLGAGGYYELRTPYYPATSIVQLEFTPGGSTNGSGSTPNGAVTPENPTQEAVSAQVAAAAAKQVGGTAAALDAEVSASLNTSSNELLLTVSDPSPARAQKIANAFAAAYVAQRSSDARSAVQILQGELNALQTQIQKLEAPATGKNGLARQQELNAALSQYQTLYGEEVAASVAGPQVYLLRPAPLPVYPSGLSEKKLGALALGIGLLAGCGIALIREQFDNRLHSRPELEDLASLPVLGEIPKDRELRREDGISIVARPRSHLAETIRELRTSLMFLDEKGDRRILLVTSPVPGEGKTFVTANLAAAWAMSNQRTIIVSADLRRPKLERLLGIPSAPEGLSTLLAEVGIASGLESTLDAPENGNGNGPAHPPIVSVAQQEQSSVTAFPSPQGWGPVPGESPQRLVERTELAAQRPFRTNTLHERVEHALVETSVPNLRLLPSGPLPLNPAELLSSSALVHVFEALSDLADVVLIDSPPVLAVADTSILGAHVDGVVVVATQDATDRDALRRALNRLVSTQSRVLGVVLNRARGAGTSLYYPYYQDDLPAEQP